MLVRNKRLAKYKKIAAVRLVTLVSLFSLMALTFTLSTEGKDIRKCNANCKFSGGSIKCGTGQLAWCGCTSTGLFNGGCYQESSTPRPKVSELHISPSASKLQLRNLENFSKSLEEVGFQGLELAESLRLAGRAAQSKDSALYTSALEKSNLVLQKADPQTRKMIIASAEGKKEGALSMSAWNLGTLGSGKSYPRELLIKNISCKGKHTFVTTVEWTPWLMIEGPPRVDDVSIGESRAMRFLVDLRNAKAGEYNGIVVIQCITCPPPPKCAQNISQLEVHLVVQ